MLLSEVLDIIRLFAVPVFIWAAYHDYHTRRVSNTPWKILAVGGALLLLADALLLTLGIPSHRYAPSFWQTVGLSLLVILPGAYVGWFVGLFGGADAKALMALSIWFPVIPQYTISFVGDTPLFLPLYTFPVTVFTITIFVNSVLLSVLYPLGTFSRNILRGSFALPMLIAKQVPVSNLDTSHGVLFETPDGYGQSADLDVLRSYLSWRDLSFSSLTPVPQPVPAENSTVDTDLSNEEQTTVDLWGTERFFEETTDLTYGETPRSLAEGLDHLSHQSSVWVSPGIPYMIPFLGGLLAALTYGNLLIWVMRVFR